MLMFTLAISCLTTSNLPWLTDIPGSYAILLLQHQILLLSPVTSTAGCCFCFGSIPSFFLELFLHWFPVAYWAPNALGREDPLEKEMVTHSSILAWKIPWTEKPGRLQSMGSQRVGHDWATSLHFTSLHSYVRSAFSFKSKVKFYILSLCHGLLLSTARAFM